MVGEPGLCPGHPAKNPGAVLCRFTNSPITRIKKKSTCGGRAAGSDLMEPLEMDAAELTAVCAGEFDDRFIDP
jgi:hypothetical protein